MSLHRRLVDLAAAAPDAVAVIDSGGVCLTRAELLDRVADQGVTAAPTATDHVRDGRADPLPVVVAMLADQAAGGTTLRLSTSGSTGPARVVRRSVASWLASLPALDEVVSGGTATPGALWAPGPASSTLTLYGIWQGLAAGVPVLASGPWAGVPQSLRDHARRAQVVHAVPTVLDSVLDTLAADGGRGVEWDLRTAVVAGAAPRAELRERADGHGVRLVEYYGAAELSFVAVDDDGTGLRPFPGVEVELRDGVLWARSPYLADEVDGVPVSDGDGWASVGDRARWTATGRLRLLGRPGAANVAGRLVSLAEVESVLTELTLGDGVAEVVCSAVPDERLGERVVCVVRSVGAGDPVPTLRRAARSLPAPARPARYRVLDELPRTPSGKVDRVALEESWTPALR